MTKASYWLQESLLAPQGDQLESASILIIGSGLTGSALAYFLLQAGFKDILLYDSQPSHAASFRNSGHILPGTVESYHRLIAQKGLDDARLMWKTSIEGCDLFKQLVDDLKIACDYRRDGYLVNATSESELLDLEDSLKALNADGYRDVYVASSDLESIGFRNVMGARFDPLGASVNPLKFRNGLLANAIKQGLRYHSGEKISHISRVGGEVVAIGGTDTMARYEAVIIATNAYANQLWGGQQRIRLEPVRGQMQWSSPLPVDCKLFPGPHSFEFGYEYGLITIDRRLMIGGWRQNTPTKESLQDLTLADDQLLQPNPTIELGLREFVKNHYSIPQQQLNWEGSWTGLMGATQTGLPYAFELPEGQIYFCGGYTGHGLPWSVKCAQTLCAWLAGKTVSSDSHLRRLLSPPK